jgi:hypothetical protein
MSSLSSTLSDKGKHDKKLLFMATNGIRQLGPPRIGFFFADRQIPEPMHVEINAWQHFLNLVYHEALHRNLIDAFVETLAAPISGGTCVPVPGKCIKLHPQVIR